MTGPATKDPSAAILRLRPDGPWFMAPVADPDAVMMFSGKEAMRAWIADQSGPVQFLPHGPRSPFNRLVARRDAIRRNNRRWQTDSDLSNFGRISDKQIARDEGWFALLDDFGTLNGWNRSKNFTLEALSRGLMHGGKWGAEFNFPGCDHATYFKRGRMPVAVVVEPYNRSEVDELVQWVTGRRLVAYVPPNPHASLYYPGAAYFAVIMPWKARPPHFLDDQLGFRKDS